MTVKQARESRPQEGQGQRFTEGSLAQLPPLLLTRRGRAPPARAPQILTGIQELLDSPNNSDAAQEPAWRLLNQSPANYVKRVKEEVRKYVPADGVL